jgi:N4-gp56 family major capsid protein
MDTTTTLSDELVQYLKEKFLERSVANNIFAEGSKVENLPKNKGKTFTWTKREPYAISVTPLTEGQNPSASASSDDQYTATLEEYGIYVPVSSKLYNTTIDKKVSETTDTISQNADETLDTLVRDALFAGATVKFANNRASLNAVTAADVLTYIDTQRVVRMLKKANAPKFSDGYYIGKVGPDTSFNLMQDPAWVNAHTYKDGKELYKGELGRLGKVRYLECSSNQKSETNTASTPVQVYSNFFHGAEALGTVNLGDAKHPNRELIIKGFKSNNEDTSNPLNMFGTVGWKAFAASKVLDPNWVINLKTGATA